MIPVFKPNFDEREINSLKSVFESGWIGLGPKTKEFETKFAKYIGAKHAVGVNSATAALHLSLDCLKIEGKEVITTPMTFVSTNHAILYNKGIPVFCDIDPYTMNIDPQKIEELITDKTAAIIAVHYGGRSCDLQAIQKICKKHNLFLLEDCAHAAGGKFCGQMLGSFGDISCFSFHAVKNLATGDGGMIVTDNDEYYDRLLKMRWVGISKDTYSRDHGNYSWFYDVVELGYKYHMNDIAASLGLVQLEKLEEGNKRRREITKLYEDELSEIKEIEYLKNNDSQVSAAHNFVIKTSYRDGLNEFLKSKDISTGVHYFPNHLYDMYKPYYRPCPIAESEWKKLLTLPLFPTLLDEEIEYIVKNIKLYFSEKKK